MTTIDAWQLIAQDRMPPADAVAKAGEPGWTLPTLAQWFALDLSELLNVLPRHCSQGQRPLEAGVFPVHR
jgi:hypothetical protein